MNPASYTLKNGDLSIKTASYSEQLSKAQDGQRYISNSTSKSTYADYGKSGSFLSILNVSVQTRFLNGSAAKANNFKPQNILDFKTRVQVDNSLEKQAQSSRATNSSNESFTKDASFSAQGFKQRAVAPKDTKTTRDPVTHVETKSTQETTPKAENNHGGKGAKIDNDDTRIESYDSNDGSRTQQNQQSNVREDNASSTNVGDKKTSDAKNSTNTKVENKSSNASDHSHAAETKTDVDELALQIANQITNPDVKKDAEIQEQPIKQEIDVSSVGSFGQVDKGKNLSNVVVDTLKNKNIQTNVGENPKQKIDTSAKVDTTNHVEKINNEVVQVQDDVNAGQIKNHTASDNTANILLDLSLHNANSKKDNDNILDKLVGLSDKKEAILKNDDKSLKQKIKLDNAPVADQESKVDDHRAERQYARSNQPNAQNWNITTQRAKVESAPISNLDSRTAFEIQKFAADAGKKENTGESVKDEQNGSNGSQREGNLERARHLANFDRLQSRQQLNDNPFSNSLNGGKGQKGEKESLTSINSRIGLANQNLAQANASAANARYINTSSDSSQSGDNVIDLLERSQQNEQITNQQKSNKGSANSRNEFTKFVQNQITVQIKQAVGNGTDRINIQLQPEHLGRLDVRLSISAGNHLGALILVERPETLELLKQDQKSLISILNDAGLSTDAGSLEFGLRNGQQGFDGGRDSKKFSKNDSNSQNGGDFAKSVLSFDPAQVDPIVKGNVAADANGHINALI